MSSYLRVLRHKDFRYLFLGQSASVIGDRAVVVAIALFVTQRTGSATDLGLVLAAQAIPLVGLLLFGGVWADRLPRHRIMVVTDLMRAGLHALLATLIFTGAVEIWQLVVIEALFGAAQAFFQPAYTGLLPQTVPESLIQDARALTESTANLAFLLGPALATALVLGVGAGAAFAFDAATFVLSALLLLRIRPRRAASGRRDGHGVRGAAQRLQRGPLEAVGMGHDRGVQRVGVLRVRMVVLARPDRRPRCVRQHRCVRLARGRGGPRRRDRLSDRHPLAPAAPAVHRAGAGAGVAPTEPGVRARHAASARRRGRARRAGSASRCC